MYQVRTKTTCLLPMPLMDISIHHSILSHLIGDDFITSLKTVLFVPILN